MFKSRGFGTTLSTSIVGVIALTIGLFLPIDVASAAPKVVTPTTLTTCTVDGVTTLVPNGTTTCSNAEVAPNVWTSTVGLVTSDRPYLGTLRYCINKTTAVVTSLTDVANSVTCKSTEAQVSWTRSWGLPSAPVIRNVKVTSPTSVMVAYSNSTANNGSQIVKYSFSANPGPVTAVHYGQGSPTMKIDGLLPDTEYSFKVCATNAAGTTCVDSSPVHTFPSAPAFPNSPTLETVVYGSPIAYGLKEPGVHSTVYPSLYTISPSIPNGLTFNSTTGALTGTPSAVQTSTTYTITQTNFSGTASGTYALTVVRKDLNVQAISESKIYGSTDPSITYSSNGLVLGDKLTGSLTRTEGENVGTYPIGQGTLAVADEKAGNYNFSFTGATFTISTKDLAITINNVSKVYGTTDPELTYSAGGLLPGDNLSGELSRAPGEEAGDYAISSTLTNSNYGVTSNNAKLTITKAPISVTAPSYVVTYGEALILGAPTVIGLVNGEESSVLKELTCSTTYRIGSTVGSSPVTTCSATSNNYEINFIPGSVTITAKAITATVINASKIYGSADPAFTYTTVGLVGSDALSGSLTRTSGENVGSYTITGTLTNPNYSVTLIDGTLSVSPKAITATVTNVSKIYGSADPAFTYTTVGLVGSDALTGFLTRTPGENVGTYTITGTLANSNYSVSLTDGTLTISPKAITATVTNVSKVYGSSDPSFTYTTVGLVGSDALTGSLTRTTGENVGNYTITGILTNSNYIVSLTDGTLSISAKDIIATVTNVSKIYGSSDPAFTYTTIGLIGNDALTGSLTRTSGENVGTYTITGTLTNSNYSVSLTDGTLSISPKAITATADNSSKIYGSADPTFTYTTIGLVGSDALTGSLSRTSGENVGTYTITGTLTNSNYSVSLTDGTLTINAKAITATVTNVSKIYGSTDPSFTYTTVGLVGSDALTGSFSRTSGENVGTYTITGTFTNSNYSVSLIDGTLSIKPKAITAIADNASKIYGSTDPAFTYTTVGLIGNDALTGSLTRTSGENVATYPIGQGTLVVADGKAGNYNLSFTSATFTISPKAMTATVTNASKIYGSADPAFTYTTEGLIGSDALTGSLTRTSGENVGFYTITGTLANSNYSVSLTNGTLSISTKAITATVTNASKIYGSTDPSFTFSTIGLVGSDALTGSLTRTSGENVGTYTTTGILANPNYSVSLIDGTLSISAKTITAAVTNASKVYGSSDPSFTYTTVGLVGSDVLTGSLTRTSGENFGSYTITGTLRNTNYSVSLTNGTLSISTKAITVTADNASKIYGSTDPSFTYTTVGLVGSDALIGSLTRTSGENVGSYTITGTLANSNYSVTFINGTFKIDAKAIVVTANNAAKTNGDADPSSFDYTTDGLVGSDTLSGALTRTSGENVGTYTITGTLTNPNYIVTLIDGTFSIKPAGVIQTTSLVCEGGIRGSGDQFKICDLRAVIKGTNTEVDGDFDTVSSDVSVVRTNSSSGGVFHPEGSFSDLSVRRATLTVIFTPKDPTNFSPPAPIVMTILVSRSSTTGGASNWIVSLG